LALLQANDHRFSPNEQNQRVPHIWPGFGQMWEFTDLALEVLRHNRHRCASIRSFHIWPKLGQIWGTLVRGKETSPHHKLVHLSINLPKGKSMARDDKSTLFITNLSSRPKRSEVERSAVLPI
jgi:hypothetical protein